MDTSYHRAYGGILADARGCQPLVLKKTCGFDSRYEFDEAIVPYKYRSPERDFFIL